MHNEKQQEMNMYKSSPQTFIFKYIFPVIMFVVGIGGFIALKSNEDELSSNFANAFGIAFIWISIFLIQMPFVLKVVEVDENGLKIRTREGVELIPYKNINTVSIFDLSSPWLITIKYSSSNGIRNRRIAYMPNSKYQRFMKKDEMTEYIISQSQANNSNYVNSNTIKNLLILALAGLPFTLGMIYFIVRM